jgi:hypothetical protein
MVVTDPPRICGIEPFRYQSVPQPMGEESSTSNQINEQSLENWASRVLEALCSDLQEIVDELQSLDSRVTALEP